MPTLTEDQVRNLVPLIRSGDQEAARLLVDAYARRLHVLATRRLAPLGCRRRLSAEDIVQSVCKSFIRCVNLRPQSLQFDADGDLFGWLATVTHRKCMKTLKKDFRSGLSNPAYDSEIAEILTRDADVTDQVVLEETIDSLMKGLEEPDKEIARRLLLGYGMNQVAEDLSRTTYAVKSVMDRLRRELSRMLEREERDDDE